MTIGRSALGKRGDLYFTVDPACTGGVPATAAYRINGRTNEFERPQRQFGSGSHARWSVLLTLTHELPSGYPHHAMTAAIVRAFLIVVVFAAALNVLIALGSGLLGAQSVAGAVLAFLGVPAVLVFITALLVQSHGLRQATRYVALGLLLLSLVAGAVALIRFVLARAGDIPAEAALVEVAGFSDAAGLALCAAGLCWGVVIAANILEPEQRAAPFTDRR